MRSLLWLIVGALTGALLATLYAPQSGKKTRKKLKKRAKQLQLELEARTEQGWDRLDDWKVSAEELVEDAAKKVNGKDTSHQFYN